MQLVEREFKKKVVEFFRKELGLWDFEGKGTGENKNKKFIHFCFG